MCYMPEKLCGTDVDVLFAYPTLKYVKIVDARLGLFKYLITFMIIVYVSVYQLWYLGGYLEEIGVTGAVRFSLQQPTHNGCDPTDSGCKNEFSSIKTLPYCTQSNGAAGSSTGSILPCTFLENIGMQVVMTNSILATTRMTQYEQVLVCNSSVSDTCPFIYNLTDNPNAEQEFYVVDAEKFTVLIDHSVIAESPDLDVSQKLQAASSEISGRLYVAKNNALCSQYKESATLDYRGKMGSTSSAPCYIAPNTTSKNLDYFSLDVLMQAADQTLDSINAAYTDETYRETGVTMLLQITYSNFLGNFKSTGDIAYYYNPILVKGSSFKYYSPQYSNYRQARVLNNMHGIFIEAVQGGSLYHLSFTNLLIQLTTSLTLFAMATVVTDFVAMYLMPDRDAYESYKYELTEDFSDRRDNQRESLAGDSKGNRIPLEGGNRGDSFDPLRTIEDSLEASLNHGLLEDPPPVRGQHGDDIRETSMKGLPATGSPLRGATEIKW